MTYPQRCGGCSRYTCVCEKRKAERMSPVTVFNLSTCEVQVFTCGPRKAVMAAYAQSKGDWSTWTYEDKYEHMVRYSGTNGRTVSCGDFAATKG